MAFNLFCQDTLAGVEESVSLVADSILKVFAFSSEAMDRCLKLTEGWGLTGLIKAIREVTPLVNEMIQYLLVQQLSPIISCFSFIPLGSVYTIFVKDLNTYSPVEKGEWPGDKWAW